LALSFDVTSNVQDIDRLDAALVYGVPAEWLGSRPEKIKNIACHLCEGEAAKWAEERGIHVFESVLIWRTVAEHTAAMIFAAARNIAAAELLIPL
jgi:phosphoglycerate dehydrogenase-like enzyme